MHPSEFTQSIIRQLGEARKDRGFSLSQPSEGMRLIEAFFSIEDPRVRAQIIQMVSSIASTVRKQKIDHAPAQADRLHGHRESHYSVVDP